MITEIVHKNKILYYITKITIHFPFSVDSFSVNLRCGRDGDYAFRYNCRFNEGQVVRKTNIGGEERDGGNPFTKQVRFFMTMLIEADCFRVFPLSIFLFQYSLLIMGTSLNCAYFSRDTENQAKSLTANTIASGGAPVQ